MALMKLTAFNGGMKGKVQGTIFQFCPYGQVVKGGMVDAIRDGARLTRADAGRVIPIRRYLTEISTGWKSLTGAQRTAWDAGASNFPFTNKWGDTYTASGFLVYMKLNLNLMKAGQAKVSNIPSPGTIENAAPFEVTYDALAGNLILSDWTPITGYTCILYATANMSIGQKPKPGMFKSIYVLDNTDTAPFNINSFYVDVFGQYAVGANLWFRLDIVNNITGQVGLSYTWNLVV